MSLQRETLCPICNNQYTKIDNDYICFKCIDNACQEKEEVYKEKEELYKEKEEVYKVEYKRNIIDICPITESEPMVNMDDIALLYEDLCISSDSNVDLELLKILQHRVHNNIYFNVIIL